MIHREIKRKATEEDRILDVGTKRGDKVSGIAGKVVGIDLTLDPQASDVEYMRADGCRMPFETNSFDYALSHHVLEHVSMKDEMVAEIERVLNPDGALYVSFPNRLSPRRPHGLPGYYSQLPKTIATRLAHRQLEPERAEYFEKGVFHMSAVRARRIFERYFSNVEYAAMKHKLANRDVHTSNPPTSWSPYVARVAPALRSIEQAPIVGKALEITWPNVVFECRQPRSGSEHAGV